MASKTKNTKSKNTRRFRIFLWLLWGGLGIGLLLFTFLMVGVANGWMGYMPSVQELKNPTNNLATEVYTADGKLLGKYFRENRVNIDFKELPPHLVDALVATEDFRFYDHSGIDARSLGRVLILTVLLQRESSGGGSTISQQLAKNLFPRKSLSGKADLALRKIKEWVIASRLERNFTKEEIIALYFNTFDFLNNAYGIKSASQVYFNKLPKELNILESATLVGMAKNPSLFNPLRRPDTVQFRRNVVLHQMVRNGYLDKAAYDTLKGKPLILDYQSVDHNEGMAPYFREQLRKFLTKWQKQYQEETGEEVDIYSDGLKIYTTIDSRMQTYAEEAMKERMKDLQKSFDDHWRNYSKEPWEYNRWSEYYKENFLESEIKRTERYRQMTDSGFTKIQIDSAFNSPHEMTIFSWEGNSKFEVDTVMTPLDSLKHYLMQLQTGFAALDPTTGEVLAWVGGTSHKYFKNDHVQLTRRQVGSTFKPFVYTMAIKELGLSPCFQVLNIPWTVPPYGPGTKSWTPKNSSGYKNGARVELIDALAHSINQITAYLMKELKTPKPVIRMVREMGVTGKIPEVPSIALGSVEISVLEMAGAYTAYVNHGLYSEPHFVTRIEDKFGKILYTATPTQREVLDWETAYVMLQFLKGVTYDGTASSRIRRYGLGDVADIGGKTGTTQENADGWFMGVTPDIVAATWVGGEKPQIKFRSTALGQGANMALPIFASFMNKVYADKDLDISRSATFDKPDEPLSIELDCSKYRNSDNDPYSNNSIYGIDNETPPPYP